MCQYIRGLIEDAYLELSFLLDDARLNGDAETAERLLAAMALLERAAALLAACQPPPRRWESMPSTVIHGAGMRGRE